MSLESLQSDQRNAERNISDCEARISSIDEQAGDLKSIYDDLKNAKTDMRNFRTSMRNFSREKYSFWVGSLHNQYSQYMLGENQANCQKVVDSIDENMALVNNRRTALLNEADAQRGILGQLRAALRSIRTAIQNWID
jgi:chromosome segregation ATPase